MALLLRAFPVISIRSKPHKFPLHHLTFLKPHFPKSLLRTPKAAFSIAASTQHSSSSSSSSTETLTPNSNPAASHPFSDSLQWVSRTRFCGELSNDDVGKRVRLCGWVALHRIHGGLTFLNLRDHTGIVQVATLPDKFPDAHSIIKDLRLEYVVAVEGIIQSRPEDSINKKMKTGTIELAAEHAEVLNAVKSKLPFLVTTVDESKDSVKEEIRLRYRCLDLRRQQMTFNIILRHKVVKFIRRYLEDVHGFVEV